MGNIFIGMLLVFLDFSIDIGSSSISLIPTFLGYIFIVKGLSELKVFSSRFSKVMPATKGMVVYSAIVYAMNLFGITPMLGEFISFLLGLITTLVSLFISHGIVIGIKDIETTKSQNLNADQLYSTWILLAIISFITFPLLLLPILAIVSAIVGFIIGIYFLYAFNKTKKLFYGNIAI